MATTTKTKPAINIFTTSVKVKEAIKKTDKKIILAPQLEDKIQQFLELKQEIDSATGRLKMIEGDIKATGRELFISEYLKQKSTPENFKIQDRTGNSCMFIVMDKYTSVDETKADFLSSMDGLITENVQYKVNPEMIEKYGAVISNLIYGCKLISEEDKPLIITGEKTFSVTKGSIDRIMQYENPAEVFELINPVVALKK